MSNIKYASKAARLAVERPFPVPPPIPHGGDPVREALATLRLAAGMWGSLQRSAISTARALFERLLTKHDAPEAGEAVYLAQVVTPAVESFLTEGRTQEAELVLSVVSGWELPGAGRRIDQGEASAKILAELQARVRAASELRTGQQTDQAT